MSNSVLIIDGDPTFAEHAQSALQSAGLQVHTRIESSVDEIRAIRPRILVLSAELPRGSGFGICSRIRRDKDLQSQLIMITTAETSDEALARHAKSEEAADDYFRKDVSIDRLVDRVGRLLSQAPTMMIPEAQDVVSEDAGPRTDPMMSEPPPLPESEPMAMAMAETPVMPVNSAVLDLWPKETYETEFIQIFGSMDIARSRSRAAPEDRLHRLLQIVKQHETREKSLRRLWTRVMGHGQILARRLVTLSAELADQQQKTADAIAARNSAQKQKVELDNQFRRFEAEIRRIFSDKDVEERAARAELDTLRTAHAQMSDELAQANEHRDDDKRRLAFLQEELDRLENARAQLEASLTRTQNRAEAAERLVEESRRVQDDLERQLAKLADDRHSLEQTLNDAQKQHSETDERAVAAEERWQVAEEARARAEEEKLALLGRHHQLTAQVQNQEEQLNESVFATEAIRNALEALLRDLVQERHRPSSPKVAALLERVERVTNMSMDAINELGSGATETEVPILPFSEEDSSPFKTYGSLRAEKAKIPLRTGGSAASDSKSADGLLKSAGIPADEPNEESSITEVVKFGQDS
ncbi:MAG: response regulator [Myxococcota bacterium]